MSLRRVLDDGADRSVTLADGRRLAYGEYGDPDGVPVIYMHGLPSSRLAPRPIAGVAAAHGIRIIAPDRPGIGLSDPLPGRVLRDWADDVTGLTDALELDRFSIWGVSGGAVMALVCAIQIPERLDHVVLIGATSHMSRPGVLEALPREIRLVYRLGLRRPRAGRLLVGAIDQIAARAPALELKRHLAYLSETDRGILGRPELSREWLLDSRETFRQGPAAAAREMELYFSDWGFSFADAKVHVQLWHGSEDRGHPLAMASNIASELPSCELEILEGHGGLWYLDDPTRLFDRLKQPPHGAVTLGSNEGAGAGPLSQH